MTYRPTIFKRSYRNPALHPAIQMADTARWALGLSILFIACLFAVFGSNSNFDQTSVVLAAGLMLVLLALLNHGSERIFAFSTILAFVILTTALPAIMMLVAFPSSVLPPLPFNGIGAVNAGLAFMYIGLLAMVLGVLAQDCLISFRSIPTSPEKAPGKLSVAVNPAIPLLAATIVYSVSQMPFVLGISQFRLVDAAPSVVNTALQLVILLFDPDSMTLLALLFACRQATDQRRKLLVILTVAICYLAITTAGGSRAGLLRLITFAVIILIVLNVKLRFEIKWVSAVLVGVTAIAALSFSIGTAVRVYQAFDTEKTPKALTAAFLHQNSDAEKTAKAMTIAFHDNFPDGLMAGAANRMAVPFLYAIVTTTSTVNEDARARFFNIAYTVKNVINNVPGTPFPEAYFETSRLFGVVYRGMDESEVQKQKGYFSEFYTVWGLATLFFDGPAALGALMLIGFVMGTAASFAWANRFRYPLGYLWTIYALPGIVTLSAGLDSTISLSLISIVRLVFSAMLLDVVGRMISKYKRDTEPAVTESAK